uniref:Uncharacterized protein n=1 Tax=Arundo donax TaxID=35708 RepID=A0A0A9BIW0_ARUDO
MPPDMQTTNTTKCSVKPTKEHVPSRISSIRRKITGLFRSLSIPSNQTSERQTQETLTARASRAKHLWAAEATASTAAADATDSAATARSAPSTAAAISAPNGQEKSFKKQFFSSKH